jgi:predicted DCC family thiol-disulfide oxidoreductase YuxK
VLTRPVVLYDGNCAFCRRWIERLRRWDRNDSLDTLPAAERHELAGLPPIDDASLDRAMHLVTPDGRVHAGGRAVAEVARYLPMGRLVHRILHLPGISGLLDAGYRAVAARRHRPSCGSPDCRFPARPPAPPAA